MTQIPAYPATVVDSPLPFSPPGSGPPVAQPAPAVPQLNVDVDTGVAAFVPPQPEAVTQLGKALNLDLSGFSTPEDARRAVQLMVERYAATGFNSDAGPVPQQQSQPYQAAPAYVPQQAPAAEPPIESAITDPKVLKHIQDLTQRVKQSEERAQRLESEQRTQQEAAYSAQITELERRTDAAIDKMAAVKYGVGGQKSFSQQVSRDNLKRLAGSIILGMQAVPGQKVPLIEDVIALAAFYDNGGQQVQPQQPIDLFAPGQAAPAQVPFGAGQVAPAQFPYGTGQVAPAGPLAPQQRNGARSAQRPITQEKDYYTQDKQYMEGARALMRRGRTA